MKIIHRPSAIVIVLQLHTHVGINERQMIIVAKQWVKSSTLTF